MEHSFSPGTPKIIQWVIKYSGGLIKNKNQAGYVLTGFIVLAIIISLFLVFGGGNKLKLPSEQEIFRMTPPSSNNQSYE